MQGVGFRPFVYRQANLLGIRGEVSNNEEGVIIHATGGRDALNAFYEDLRIISAERRLAVSGMQKSPNDWLDL